MEKADPSLVPTASEGVHGVGVSLVGGQHVEGV